FWYAGGCLKTKEAGVPPIPATKYRSGELATILVSTKTRAGLCLKNSTPDITPSGEYMTDSAEQGASFDAKVGTMTTGICKRSAINFPASMHFPPPTAIKQSSSFDELNDFSCLVISSIEHSPPNLPIAKRTFAFFKL